MKSMQLMNALLSALMTASKARDFVALRKLMTEDAVVLPPNNKALCGRQELEANFAQQQEALRQLKILDYVLDFQEVKILGNYAYEWAQFMGECSRKERPHWLRQASK